MKDNLTTEEQDKIIKGLLKKPQNELCSDCNGKTPCWASLDFGVFICMNCSGAHRALGPSITRVKSIALDSWNKNWVQNMKIGNSIINQYWQHQLDNINKKPNVNTSLDDIKKYVVEKYVKKRYINTNQQYDPLTKYKKGVPIVSNKKINTQYNINNEVNNKSISNSNNKITPQKVVKQNTLNIQKKIQQPITIINKPTSSQKVQLIDFEQDNSHRNNGNKVNTTNNNNTVTFENFLQNISIKQIRQNKNNSINNHPVQQQKIHGNYFISAQNGCFANLNHVPHPHGFSLPSHQPHTNHNVANLNSHHHQQQYIPQPFVNMNSNNLYNNNNHHNNNNNQKVFQFNDFFTGNISGPAKISNNSNITLEVTLNSDKKQESKNNKNWVDDWM